jgi:two-component system sensor histidine kinase NblS
MTLESSKFRSNYQHPSPSRVRMLLNKDLKIILLNKEALILLECNNRSILGTSVLLYLPYSLRLKILPVIKKVLINSDGNNNLWPNVTFSLTQYQETRFSVTLRPLLESNNTSVKAILLSLTHIINQKEQNPLTNNRINSLSHELRAPLFNIRSFLETLYEYNSELDNGQRLEFLEIATNETNRLNRLVNDILDFAEIGNEIHYQIPNLSLNNILEESLQLNLITAIKKYLLLVKKTDLNQLDIVINDDSILRILSNLLNNAIKFTYPYAVIQIKVKIIQSFSLHKKYNNSSLRFCIVDNGIGIPREDTRVVFNPFTRVSKEKNIVTGSGLGLPIVKETLATKCQKLNLSTYPHKGTNVSFNLQF